MEDGRELTEFWAKLTSMGFALRKLRDDRVIGDRIYWKFMKQMWTAKTMKQLQRIDHDLAKLVEAKKCENS